MPIELLMPALSPTMTEGKLARWLKKEGDPVVAGEAIAEIETDKATMEFEAVDEGTLGRILVPEGAEGVKVNQPIALLLEEGEDKAALDKAKPAASTPRSTSPQPSPPPGAEREGPAKREGEVGNARPKNNSNAESHRLFISPLARRLAAESKVDLSQLTGSGPHGRIVRADIESAVKGAPPAAARSAPAAAPVAAPRVAAPAVGSATYDKDQVALLAGGLSYTEVPLTSMRRVVARRLTESKQTVPHFYLTIDCEIDRLLAARSEINAAGDQKLSVNDFIIRAAALALRKVPKANASWSETAILQWNAVDISVAVALENGLITPIIKSADQKGLGQISTEMKDLAERARAGKLKPAEFQGGTFTISNLGMYGIKHFAAVINPPQGCILAVGAGEQRPVVKDGALSIATVMTCTLAVDHRVVDGAVGAEFLAAFKKFVESPVSMLL